MKIGEDQVRVLRAGIHRRITEAVLADVCARLGRETAAMTEQDLRALVYLGAERAVSFHVRSQKHIGRYVELMIRYGRAFDADPANRGVLLSRVLSPEGKLDLLERRLGRRTGS